jgi:two-component system, response regulator PdtaR
LGEVRLVKIKIFIVEDEIILANDLKQQLEKLGYLVVGIASNGKDAIKKTEEINPDLILMDIVLRGDLDGIETARKIREIYDIPFIYLTSYYDDEILIRAKNTYPYGYITKPYADVGVHAAIQIALHKNKNDKEIKKLLENMQNY